jgi:hypothetical protein
LNRDLQMVQQCNPESLFGTFYYYSLKDRQSSL